MRKLILRNFLSPGDIVLLTAAVRDLHRCYPNEFVTDIRTSCPQLWENNQYITPLDEADPDVKILDCDYPLIGQCNQTPYHCLHGFIDFLNDVLHLSIRPTAFSGDIHITDLEKSWFSQVHELTGEDTPFWIVVAGGKFDVTIKWWQTERYQEVVDHFRNKIQFVQVGERGHYHPKLNGVIDLRGQTDLRQLVRLVYHSQGILCGVTALMHLAAAVDVKGGSPLSRPCVVVAGGREPVHWEAYPQHQFIHTVGQLPCCAHGGCWRARTLPLGDGNERDRPERLCVDVVGKLPRCMDMIASAEVIRRIEGYFDGGVLRYLTPEQATTAAKGVLATASNPFDSEPLSIQQPAKSCLKTILIQQASGFHTQMLDLSSELHATYAARHDLTFWSVRGNVEFERSPEWNKILLIRMALWAGFELVVWLDADTLIVRPEVDVRTALLDGPPIGMCRHPLPLGDQSWHYDSGVIFVRNTKLARVCFDNIWPAEPVEHSWQEQVRLNELNEKYPNALQPVDDQWNSTQRVNPTPNPVIRAWHGKGQKAIKLMKAALAAYHRKNSGLPSGAERLANV
jgi:ADP-heptose:LPS heptosyltransferase